MIILAVIRMFTFTTYYDPSPTLWEVVDNSISSFWKLHNYQKLCISGAVCSLLPTLTYPQWYTMLPLVHLLQGSSQGFTWLCYQSWGVNLVALWLILKLTPPRITGGACMCLSVVLPLNKCHYWLVRKGKYNGYYKVFLYCTIEMTLA